LSKPEPYIGCSALEEEQEEEQEDPFRTVEMVGAHLNTVVNMPGS
jgi:hypothetical protein